ncbi:MAG: cysteine hydrolase [Rhodanobacter sp. 68-29]|mgnify:CR=1 FL=1|uniref:cysteine hydrolase family protein n=1 Tax=Rhodanobacter sp. PCA2 TaxID=2006117 RepID=UPI00086C5DF1|nr:cysteine hydrolase family protein [Rhodanobacter sp. PCA2]MBA2080074.1 cysteine hydrolase [Rhodanobacter sp. PCA2]MBN8924655.1 cysteine hydrolase [Rhodanobacter sp.]ODU73404.1 MAG: isochorismatase [Rhodanobacter sp. SCN 69-32]OJY57190.1 MAG: cysteine hydrolase [Rhodanobacter sp. 68-29]
MTEVRHPRRALVVIDVQNEYDSGGLHIQYPPVADSLRNIGRAMDAAHAAGIPVVVVQQTAPADSPLFAAGTHGWELHAVVASRPREHHLLKALPSAFAGTDLGDWLAAHAIDTLAVVGYMTHNCNDTTIKHAFDAGLAVEFLMDASGSVPYANRAGHASAEEIHRVFAVVEQSRFAAVMTTDEWLAHVADGSMPERDNIHASHQRALSRLGAAA